jgi:uncharacterized FAD-dependent dehydrogenase
MKTFRLWRNSKSEIGSNDLRAIADDISMYVQEHGGGFIINRNSVDFYIPNEYTLFVKMMYPMLKEV